MARKRPEVVAVRLKTTERLVWRLAAGRLGYDSLGAWMRSELNRRAMEAIDDLDLETAETLDPAQGSLELQEALADV